ncbi:L10-interacting MYB domain-containing protein [Ziziphus jujuba]|uniref:L10-interacting MYB domain-containing protein n=1 Tax=Ziziphus jujuba TaxID=326968 RepID=A0A6P3ZPJ5_ZIZJJ|nr:L10-interacting MYB domain-containing protein [Ziziphus jujuba]XP_048326449.2 L10-interacting MYB domain-containing protein [Ziziphus jujuba]
MKDTGGMESAGAICGKRPNDGSATSLSLSGEHSIEIIDVENEHFCDVPVSKSADKAQNRRSRAITGEQSLSSTSTRKARANWAPAIHEVFVDLCLEETFKGNKPGTHFNKEGWTSILELFHKKTGLRYDRLQLKNHWDVTKEQWKVWCKLIGTASMKWDPITNEFGATEADWSNYLQKNPEATQFRFEELQCADKLETIFHGTTVIGETEPPTQRRKHNHNSSASMLHMEQSISPKPLRMAPCLPNPVEPRTPLIINQKSAVPVPTAPNKLTYSIGECIDCLDAMEEVKQGSDLYLFALDVFLKKEYREIFLQLKKASVRISWLQRLQSVGSPLK